jgi:hypothetical protein
VYGERCLCGRHLLRWTAAGLRSLSDLQLGDRLYGVRLHANSRTDGDPHAHPDPDASRVRQRYRRGRRTVRRRQYRKRRLLFGHLHSRTEWSRKLRRQRLYAARHVYRRRVRARFLRRWRCLYGLRRDLRRVGQLVRVLVLIGEDFNQADRLCTRSLGIVPLSLAETVDKRANESPGNEFPGPLGRKSAEADSRA